MQHLNPNAPGPLRGTAPSSALLQFDYRVWGTGRHILEYCRRLIALPQCLGSALRISSLLFGSLWAAARSWKALTAWPGAL
eukprot:5514858-Amphidinium_carterae.1